MSDSLTTAVREALRKAPCSVRALAREAGVPHSSLVRIQAVQLSASPTLAHSMAKALRKWGDRCDQLAGAIEQAATRKGD